MAGTEATPRPGQVDAVAALLSANQRVLVVQATGWGKSACTGRPLARRDEGAGPTIVISPLLALMRDQVAAAERVGIRAATVNSANRDDWDLIFDELARDAVDVLLVSPSGSPTGLHGPCDAGPAQQWTARDRRSTLHLDWGFDFRPDYQRIAKLLVHLDASIPVLATTATATSRVIDDLTFQLGPTTKVIRGPLARRSRSLAVVPGLNAVERFAWVADAIRGIRRFGDHLRPDHRRCPRTGCVPARRGPRGRGLTRADATGHSRTDRGETARERPQGSRCDLRLGHGLRQAGPGVLPPCRFAQLTGRLLPTGGTGRASAGVGSRSPATGRGESDQRIWDYFITATLPDPQEAQRVPHSAGRTADVDCATRVAAEPAAQPREILLNNCMLMRRFRRAVRRGNQAPARGSTTRRNTTGSFACAGAKQRSCPPTRAPRGA